jgi:CHAD domain-containing protein
MNSAKKSSLSARAAKQILIDALDKRWKKYRSELKRCRLEFSNEAVHDLRIAARRMLAILQLLNSISPRPRLQKMSRAFKDQLDEFDDLRDTQVMLAEISESMRELPQLQKLQHRLQKDEVNLLGVLRKKLKSVDLSGIEERLRKTRESIESDTSRTLSSQILQAVDDAFLLTRQRTHWIDPAQPATIHRVRLAFKVFRYMVEIVHSLLNHFPSGLLERMNTHQSLMGEIQDIEVIMQTLADFSPPASFDSEPVRRYYTHRHAEAASTFMKSVNDIDQFWRSAPDQPFPWEK